MKPIFSISVQAALQTKWLRQITQRKQILLFSKVLKKLAVDKALIDAMVHESIFTEKILLQKIPLSAFFMLGKMAKQCQKGFPMAYLLKEAPFLTNMLKVEPGVFIPRPETEEFVIYIQKKLQKLWPKALATPDFSIANEHMLEIGFGSGAISIALQQAFPKLAISAIDISKKAFKLATANAQDILGPRHSIQFMEADAFTHMALQKQTFSLLVSNPPYVAEHSKDLAQEVRKFEPASALFAGADGLRFYRKMASYLPKFCTRDSLIFFEIGFDQAADVISIFSFLKNKHIEKDFLGKPRFFSAVFSA